MTPYLLAELVGLVPLLVALYLAPSRVSSIAAGLVLTPFFPLALLHEGNYWTPVRTGGLALSIEDVLYLFMSGAIAYTIASLLGRLPVFRLAQWRRTLVRISVLVLLGAAALAGLLKAGLDAYQASLAAAVFFLATGAFLRPARVPGAIIAGAVCALLHIGNIAIVAMFAPDFMQSFQAHESGRIYLQESAFQFAFAAAHVLLFSWTIEGDASGRSDTQRRRPES